MDWATVGAIVGIPAAEAEERYRKMRAWRLAGPGDTGSSLTGSQL